MTQTVEELSSSMQLFGIADYVVFVMMLLLSAVIGIYYGFFAKASNADDYLVGGRNMDTFPIAMSLIASFISGITLLGLPTETYLYGTQYLYIAPAIITMGFIMGAAYIPVFHDMKLTSTYEYLELRFDKNLRLLGSILFVMNVIFWIPIVIYVPALAFNQVTGVNVHIITPIVCVVCIFYTCVGGLKAVVWTDVIQTIIMFGAMVLVIVKGTYDLGGFGVVWQRNMDSDRIEAPNLSPDPTERHTLMILLLAGTFYWVSTNVGQIMVQRYLALPSLGKAKVSLWIFVFGCIFIIYVCGYAGMVIYAKYNNCDPLTTKLAKAKDQLLPLFVMDTLGIFPGLPGLFVAGVFSAALSSMSTALNSSSAVIYEDFFKTFYKRNLTARQSDILMKSVVLVIGTICALLVFVVEKLGAVLQVSMSLGAMTNGPALGLFTMGIFIPWVNAKGALVGGITGLSFMGWIILGTQATIASGGITFKTKALHANSCNYTFIASNVTKSISDLHRNTNVMPLYRMSYLWYTACGCCVAIITAVIVSFLTGPTNPADVDPNLMSPIIRRFLPSSVKKKQIGQITTNGYKAVELQILEKGDLKKAPED